MRFTSSNADAIISNHPGALLWGAQVTANTTNDASLEIHDKPSATGIAQTNRMLEIAIDTSIEGNSTTKTVLFPKPIKAGAGIYANITGTSAEYTVYWDR